MARTQRGSVTPVATTGLNHTSWACAGIVYGGDFTIKSGGPSGSAKVHARSFGHLRGAGRSFGSPIGAPASTHRRIVSISSSDSDRSFLNCWMPTVLSMCQGGICRAAMRARIARAQGRTVS